MGRLLGSHDSDPLDRPDLNKCPDCGCFFAQEKCPLCGKVCPEEFRAGNRKKVKPPKRKRGDSGRVTFVEWYHSWWFIILMMFVMPIVGIILLATSPHKKSIKITVAVIAIIYCLLPFIFNFLFIGLFQMFNEANNTPQVNDTLTKEEYIDRCEEVNTEDFYRNPDKFKGKYLTMELVVVERVADDSSHDTYYICKSTEGGEWTLLVRDCLLDGVQNYIKGDLITVYGEGADSKRIYDSSAVLHEEPCIYMAYAEIHK